MRLYSFSWVDARAEMEFIAADLVGNIIPIEVKSGKRTKAFPYYTVPAIQKHLLT
ncbi:MAG TPA: hypothetical protein VKY35_04895 [Aliidiomarina sp.]|nr:hypothetical protein [Aliidiomarina sp.]